jgi:hypothetical protein
MNNSSRLTVSLLNPETAFFAQNETKKGVEVIRSH